MGGIMRAWMFTSLVFVMAPGVLGCAHHDRRRKTTSSGAMPLEAVLPPIKLGPLPLDDRLVGTLHEVDDTLRPSLRTPAEYRSLSAEQCQCLAVKASSEGNSLAAERRALTATAKSHGFDEEERGETEAIGLRVAAQTDWEEPKN